MLKNWRNNAPLSIKWLLGIHVALTAISVVSYIYFAVINDIVWSSTMGDTAGFIKMQLFLAIFNGLLAVGVFGRLKLVKVVDSSYGIVGIIGAILALNTWSFITSITILLLVLSKSAKAYFKGEALNVEMK